MWQGSRRREAVIGHKAIATALEERRRGKVGRVVGREDRRGVGGGGAS